MKIIIYFLSCQLLLATLSNANETKQENAEELYYEACSQCHSAMEPSEHTALEWEGIFDSMKEQAQLDSEEEEIIIKYLKKNSKDSNKTIKK